MNIKNLNAQRIKEIKNSNTAELYDIAKQIKYKQHYAVLQA